MARKRAWGFIVLACMALAGVGAARGFAADAPPRPPAGDAAISGATPSPQGAASVSPAIATPLSYERLVQALQDRKNRESVIPRDLPRATGLSDEQRRSLLGAALASESPTVRSQAAVELQRRGWLEQVVRDLLLELAHRDDPDHRRAAIVALERIYLPQPSREYWQTLIEALGDPDRVVSEAAARQLRDQGPEAVPLLLQTMNEGTPVAQQRAAGLLSEIVGSKGPRPSPGIAEAPVAAPATPAAAESSAAAVDAPAPRGYPRCDARGAARRQAVDGPVELVRVYFGCNREVSHVTLPPLWSRVAPFLLLAGALLGYTADTFRRWKEMRRDGEKPERAFASLLIVGILMVLCWSGVELSEAVQERWARGAGPRFGPRRSPDGMVACGHCDVSLPATHAVGEVEQSGTEPADESQDVVLRRTVLLDTPAFYEAVRRELAGRPADAGDCLVFVHGLGVGFEEAARRTAQIHHDLQFPGVSLFFSWPSRGDLRGYPADRCEIEFTQEQLKQFLVGVADQVQAGRIHVLAHGLGAAAAAHAIAGIDRRDVVFDQVVLAAPDIGVAALRDKLLPKLVRHGRRTTVYCSRNDLTLHVADAFNDVPRAGDSACGTFVAPGVDTIDVSPIATDLLGHTSYADAVPLLDDVAVLLQGQPPTSAQRHLHPRPTARETAFWTLGDQTARN